LLSQQIENPLSKAILSGRFGPKDTIRVGVQNGQLVFGEEPAVDLAK
jgi:ATP-dependent Clp protease ATP-binding subunit ClpB